MLTAIAAYSSTSAQPRASRATLRHGNALVEGWQPPAMVLDIRLTPTAFRLLITLSAARTPGGWLPLTQRELAEALHLDPRHVGRTLRTLGRAGYVERIRWRGPARFAYRTRRQAHKKNGAAEVPTFLNSAHKSH